MRSLCVLLAGCFVLAFAVASQADDAKDKKAKIDKSKLVGTWTFVKTDSKEAPPPGATIKVEFTKDGKVTITQSLKDKSATFKGTYTVEGDQLTTVIKYGEDEKKEVMTVKELTDKKFVTTEKKGDDIETTEFKK